MPWCKQFAVLLQRCFLHQLRNPMVTATRISVAILLSCITGGIFWQRGDSQALLLPPLWVDDWW